MKPSIRLSKLTLVRVMSCLLLFGAAIAQGHAAEQSDPAPPGYQGAYWAIQGHLGTTTGLSSETGIEGGPSFGLSLRLASIVSIADVQLTVLGSTYAATLDGSRQDVLRMSLGTEAHLHPFFLLTLNDSYVETWLAGIYLSLGVDLDLTGIGNAPVEPDFGWHVGAGTDIPLTSLANGSSLWLGLGLRLKFLEIQTPSGSDVSFDETTIVLTFGYRDHDINFMRLPRPTELYESIQGEGE